eukprot:6056433-Amphidinium_carterae.1
MATVCVISCCGYSAHLVKSQKHSIANNSLRTPEIPRTMWRRSYYVSELMRKAFVRFLLVRLHYLKST